MKRDEREEPITQFGQRVTADTKVANERKDRALSGQKYSIIFYDEGTGWTEPAADANKTAAAAKKALRQLAGQKPIE